MKTVFISILFFTISFTMNAQNDVLPYYNIPEASETYTLGSVVSRMIDGLGFRYRWATEELRSEDLSFKPNQEARTTEQTIDHILGLSQVILNSVLNKPNGTPQPEMTFKEKREKTLKNLQEASKILRDSKDLSQNKMIFGKTEFPFWNVINGPISDALWHVGQVVSFRRSSGNPLPKGVNVLKGEKRG